MRKILAFAVMAAMPLALPAKPKLVTAAIYDYTPDGQLKSVLTPTSDTAAVKTTYKKTYIGGGKVRVSVYRKTLENPSFAQFDYDESKAIYEVASIGGAVARGDSPGRLVSSYVARAGRKLVETDALGNKTIYKYNRKGHLAKIASPNGVVAYKYDKRGRLAATVDPLGRVTKRLYDRDGRLAGTVNPLGGRTIVKFDKFGRRIARRGAGTYPLTFKYNSFGQMTSYTDDNGNTTSFQYDKHGRLATRVWPDGSTIRYSYDKKKGLLTKKVEADRTTRYTYDDMNRLVGITTTQGADKATTNLTYSKTGQLLSIETQDKSSTTDITDTTDKKLNGTTSSSFQRNTLKPRTHSSSSSSSIRSIRTIRGSKVLYSYDDFNRVILEQSDNGTVAYKYNPKGLLASKKVSIGSLRSPSAKSTVFTTTYAYDDLDRLTTIESPAGKYVYQYNKLGRIKSLTMGEAKVNYKYDKASRLTAKTLLTNGKKTIIAAYKYDKLNRRVNATVLDTAWKYKYDKRNQLIGALGEELTTKNTKDTKNGNLSGSAPRNRKNIRSIRSIRGRKIFSYGFDPIGNRTQFSSSTAGGSSVPSSSKLNTTLLAYNDLNQLTTASPATLGKASMLAGDYQYDTYGNLISTPKANYRYNLNNRLVEINQKDSRLTFAYDPNGRRIFKKVFDKDNKLTRHTKFLYSEFKCVAEIDAISNKVEKFYQWQGEQLLGIYNPEKQQALSVLTDGNKNVIGLMGGNGEISAKFAYSPFGKLLSSQGADVADCSFGFSSEYLDKETSLVYYNFRYLNTELGKWMTRDPIKENGGWNQYCVVFNSIVNLNDKKGLLSFLNIWGNWYETGREDVKGGVKPVKVRAAFSKEYTTSYDENNCPQCNYDLYEQWWVATVYRSFTRIDYRRDEYTIKLLSAAGTILGILLTEGWSSLLLAGGSLSLLTATGEHEETDELIDNGLVVENKVSVGSKFWVRGGKVHSGPCTSNEKSIYYDPPEAWLFKNRY